MQAGATMGVTAHLQPECSAEIWLSMHTRYCLRYRARLTADTCQKNSKASATLGGDLRCFGCFGLQDQPELSPKKPVFTVIQGGAGNEVNWSLEPQPPPADTWNQIELWEEPEPEKPKAQEPDRVSPVITDSLTYELLASLNAWVEDEDEKPEKNEAPRRRVALPDIPDQARRVKVYTGHCERCKGFMMYTAKETGNDGIDDEVYRCIGCGWRVSPVYQENRRTGARIW